MKFILNLCLLLAICSHANAQEFTYNQGGTSSKNYYEEIPYQTINGKMFIQVELHGKKHKFLFDTGAPVAISPELVKQIKAKFLDEDTLSDVNGVTDTMGVVQIPQIKIGKVTFDHIPAITLFPDFYRCWGIDGVIGSNILRNSIVSINGAKQVIILTDQLEKLKLNDSYSSPMITNTSYQSNPIIKILLKDNITVDLGFDTGDNEFLRISEDLVNQLPETGIYEILAKGYGANTIGGLGLQQSAEKYLIRIPQINIGNGLFNNTIVETNKSGSSAIGSKILLYGIVTLDFIHNKFYFNSIKKDNEVREKQWPFVPTVINDRLAIGVVWDKYKNEVKPGQRILAIDNVDYSKVTLCDMLNRPHILAGKQTATITVKDDQGNLQKIQISKVHY
ncbi:retropepsin-like aspartic protease [Pedobacter cryoconitis]|uniref:Aspartyl protease n=1 Tax=Pedobacter cryoconitis TaxID=188932 RepID=A0A327SB97_9SPHI|nr:retropepsin-like aspartic protease [Pedobacter cryoconitis]RAJ24923.1 aspartyl protease [Pedobacter cryoconitis]